MAKTQVVRSEILKIPLILKILILTKPRGVPKLWIPAFAGMTGLESGNERVEKWE